MAPKAPGESISIKEHFAWCFPACLCLSSTRAGCLRPPGGRGTCHCPQEAMASASEWLVSNTPTVGGLHSLRLGAKRKPYDLPREPLSAGLVEFQLFLPF